MSEILVVAEHRQGQLRPPSLELVGAAHAARRAPSDRIVVALIAQDASQLVPSLSVTGVDEIVTVRSPVAEFEPEIFARAVRGLIEARRPALVLLPHSVDSFGYAAALAAHGGCGFATDIFKIEYDSGGKLIATRGGYGQKVAVEVEFPDKDVIVLAVRAGVFRAPEGSAAPQVTTFETDLGRARTSSVGFIDSSSADDVDMAGVEFILAIGRGVGEQANVERFRELAAAIGATLGCSRPVADAGWLPKSRQIGQSGKTASGCKLYIAMGISGAIQHLAGMKHVATIVAVNSDPGASIFSVAKYGIVGDLFEVAEALEQQFK
ncbi:MAG TPA: electron transfer flavoprotein subunit alpha/FixB family protein [Steroidobacteraceae bacterium]|nr:electron transfer flavoprotein subunit alpha/FixB family protein [Steroidobacteraceae bacterium]